MVDRFGLSSFATDATTAPVKVAAESGARQQII